jgi:hypothetical protein
MSRAMSTAIKTLLFLRRRRRGGSSFTVTVTLRLMSGWNVLHASVTVKRFAMPQLTYDRLPPCALRRGFSMQLSSFPY